LINDIRLISFKAAQGFEPDDPLFPATRIALGANHHFVAVGLERKHWRDAGAIRRIFKQAFERAEPARCPRARVALCRLIAPRSGHRGRYNSNFPEADYPIAGAVQLQVAYCAKFKQTV
jgi:hypothetical protein